ncbi:MAG TPA: HIT family protein [Methylocella sp.]|jgi:diadenosine tetraphosphate (Ap4A) HIT family hydrolase
MNTMNESCIFCALSADDVIAENDLAIAIRDKYPVTHLHSLIIPARHVINYFDCSAEEREAIHHLLVQCRLEILCADASVTGFNVGTNVGKTAGQKIPHVHVHLIPRRKGDIAPPPAYAD